MPRKARIRHKHLTFTLTNVGAFWLLFYIALDFVTGILYN